jgi:hypothetical protein
MRLQIRYLRGLFGLHRHDFRLGEAYCRWIACTAQQRVGENDVILEIIGRAIQRRGIEQLAQWLITPRGGDGRTVTEVLLAGEYDRARMLAVATTSAESARRRRPMPGTGGGE